MTRFYKKTSNGVSVKGHNYEQVIGSRSQVWHSTAHHTTGGLTKSQLMMNKTGRIVSRKKHSSAKRENRLVKAGYLTKKGHFGFIKSTSSSKKYKNSRKHHRGGSGINHALSPANYDGKGEHTSGANLQLMATNY